MFPGRRASTCELLKRLFRKLKCQDLLDLVSSVRGAPARLNMLLIGSSVRRKSYCKLAFSL